LNARRRTLAILALAGIAVAAIISVTYVADYGRNNTASLPAGCAKPAGGFLVIASDFGYNDSIGHGAPDNSWPIITVHQGQNVTIVVCNVDVQAHGFQIANYFAAKQETLVPGQVLRVNFFADQKGSFVIYCDIICSIHAFMQTGLLKVTA
jgi:heme/copper-type cytochrome/quinol oxidase subunit 2